MKTIKYLGMLLAMLALSVSFVSCSSDDDDEDGGISANPEEEMVGAFEKNGVLQVNVRLAGSVESMIGHTRKFQTEKMKIKGPLNGDDIRCIRDMMISSRGGRLEYLDMSDVNIVAGGGWYYGNANDWAEGESIYVTKPDILGECMFDSCDVIEELILPNSVVRVDHHLFGYSENRSIRSITIGKYTIGQIWHEEENRLPLSALTLGSLEEINVHPDNTKYSSEKGIMYDKSKTFLYTVPCKYRGTLSLPTTLKTIGDNAFGGVAASSIELPNSVKRLESSAFSYSKIRKINTGSVSEMGDYVFSSCSAEDIILSESLTCIPQYAFFNCNSLSSITIPSSVKIIEYGAFDSENLKTINIKNSNPPSFASDINHYYNVFYGANQITIVVPKGSKSRYQSAFIWSECDIIENAN